MGWRVEETKAFVVVNEHNVRISKPIESKEEADELVRQLNEMIEESKNNHISGPLSLQE